jgi:hypothetical protein
MSHVEELERYYAEGNELMDKVGPIFHGTHPFVMMMVLANLCAQWLLQHPELDRADYVDTLAAAIEDCVSSMLVREKGTEH